MNNKTTVGFENKEFFIREDVFVKVPVSELSLDDEFLKHRPKTKKEQEFKAWVKKAIKKGVKDFYRPKYDPHFDDDGHICYGPGKMPAVGKSYNWWEENAKNFWPERGSRLGTKTEYIAFLAVLIKELVDSGKSVEWAWNAVCNDSNEFGHYWHSKNAKHAFEDTGSREICGFYDLANTCKFLAEHKGNDYFWLASGAYYSLSFATPLVDLCLNDDCYCDYLNSCGWLVLESCSDC